MNVTERITNAIPTGENNAIPLSELHRISGMSDSRATRTIIEKLRRDGTVICSSECGYYYPADVYELRHYVNRERARARSINITLSAAETLLEKWSEGIE